MKKNERITQIIPATGWYSKYKDDDGSIMLCRVMCFALVAVTGEGEPYEDVRAIDGLEGKGDYAEFSDTISNFEGLIHESDPRFAAIRDKPKADI